MTTWYCVWPSGLVDVIRSTTRPNGKYLLVTTNFTQAYSRAKSITG